MRYIFSTIIVVLFTAEIKAEITKEMNLHYEESDFTIDRNDDMVIKVDATNLLRMDNSYDFNRPFLPELVYQVAQLKGNDYFDTELIVEHSDPILIAENVKIAVMLPLPYEGNDWIVYDFCNQKPLETVRLTHSLSAGWNVWVRPYIYELTTGNLYFTKDITIKATFKRKTNSLTL